MPVTPDDLIFTVRAFVDDSGAVGGNLAGVVVVNSALCPPEKQAIARQLGYSETAFVSVETRQHQQVEFYTPNQQVDLCGHATLATYAVLLQQCLIDPGTLSMHCPAGKLAVNVREDAVVSMVQVLPQFGEIITPQRVAACLNISAEQLEAPIQVVSTGLRKILCPLTDRAALNAIRPDYPLIMALSEHNDTTGIYCFTLDAPPGYAAICRNFAPRVGIYEDAATGTSAGALGCYLWHHRRQPLGAYPLQFAQGHAIASPSSMQVNLTVDGPDITSVTVSGKSTITTQHHWQDFCQQKDR